MRRKACWRLGRGVIHVSTVYVARELGSSNTGDEHNGGTRWEAFDTHFKWQWEAAWWPVVENGAALGGHAFRASGWNAENASSL